MSLVSVVCFAICFALFLSVSKDTAALLSPARLFGFIWAFSIGLTELKLSRLQHHWSPESWVLLLLGLSAFLLGTFVAYVLNLQTPLLSLRAMRERLKEEHLRERRLYWLILALFAVYATAYILNYRIRGWLPLDVIGTAISRVDFNVSGLTLWLYAATPIIIFTLVYFVFVRQRPRKSLFLGMVFILTAGSFFLLLMRYPIIMAGVVAFVVLYYATHYIRWNTALLFLGLIAAFFYWISSIRLSNVVSTYLYSISKMRFSKEYAFFTEPYMYVVTNLENFARSVDRAQYHTYGYFTLDFITAITGLKYWVLDYFNFERTPYLTSNYNTYTAFYWFYSDFGVLGLGLIPLILGFTAGLLYYRMRSAPTLTNVTGYGFAVFCMVISYFNFPLAFLWFQMNLLAMFVVLRWVITPRTDDRGQHSLDTTV